MRSIIEMLSKLALLVILLVQIINLLTSYVLRSKRLQPMLKEASSKPDFKNEVAQNRISNILAEMLIIAAWILILYVFQVFSLFWLGFLLLELGGYAYVFYRHSLQRIAQDPWLIMKEAGANWTLIVNWLELICVAIYASQIFRMK